MTSAIVELKGVTRSYGSPPTQALRGVDLAVEEGEFVAVVGPSGSGKTTMLNVIGTLDRADAGDVRICGVGVNDLADAAMSGLRAHLLGFVFQHFHLAPEQTALDNVAAGLLYLGVPRRARRDRARDALAAVGLHDRALHRAKALSGGERQRVAMARAIIGRPRLLLADEPTGSLDTAAGAVVLSILRRLNDEGTTIVLITHDQQLARSLPRQVTMCDGRITEDSRDAA